MTKILPFELEINIIRKAINLELKERLNLRNNKEKMLFSLLINTHCHGCGRKNKVSLTGYLGSYCNKVCWKWFKDDTQSGYDENYSNRLWYIYEKYSHIEKINLSCKTLSLYHRRKK